MIAVVFVSSARRQLVTSTVSVVRARPQIGMLSPHVVFARSSIVMPRPHVASMAPCTCPIMPLLVAQPGRNPAASAIEWLAFGAG